jgi:hypothetical protein
MDIVDDARPLVYRVEVGDAIGTAFLVSITSPESSGQKPALLFATAGHVVKEIDSSGPNLLLRSSDNSIVYESKSFNMIGYRIGSDEYDTGIIYVRVDDPPVSVDKLLPLLPHRFTLRQGAEVGWLGYPGLANPYLCFFSGVVSSHVSEPIGYLIDGVAIHGVSGGPAFNREGAFAGIVSQYIPNLRDDPSRKGGKLTLPGLLWLPSAGFLDYWMDTNLQQIKINQAGSN